MRGIKENDLVTVQFFNEQWTHAKVIRVADNAGDFWIFRGEGGEIMEAAGGAVLVIKENQ